MGVSIHLMGVSIHLMGVSPHLMGVSPHLMGVYRINDLFQIFGSRCAEDILSLHKDYKNGL